MVTYLSNPQVKFTVAGEDYEGYILDGFITRVENGVDSGSLRLHNDKGILYPNVVTGGTAMIVRVQDANGTAWPATYRVLNGVVASANPSMTPRTVTVKLDGAGFMFNNMVVRDEYGTASSNTGLNTITTILTNASEGVIPEYVNDVLNSGTSSGVTYACTGATVDTISNIIHYVHYPFVPASRVTDDLCDLVTALQAGSAGPHWIVDVDNKFRLKLISSTQTGWTKYYGDSQAAATLVEGVDFTDGTFKVHDKAANYVIYNGVFRRPSNGDYWTEGTASLWHGDPTDMEVADETGANNFIIGSQSLRFRTPSAGGGFSWFPGGSDLTGDAAAAQKDVAVTDGTKFRVGDSVRLRDDSPDCEVCEIASIAGNTLTMVDNLTNTYTVALDATCNLNANWDFTSISTPDNIPTISFNAMKTAAIVAYIRLFNDETTPNSKYWYFNLTGAMANLNQWYHFELPCGPHYLTRGNYVASSHLWTEGATTPSWDSVQSFQVNFAPTVATNYLYLDGLHLGNVPITRIARNKFTGAEGGTMGTVTDPVRMITVTDNVGKDDSCVASDDSGLMAQLAYQSLLRGRTTPTIGTFTTDIIPDLLPGQLLHIHALPNAAGTFQLNQDMRVTSLTHRFAPRFSTIVEVTSDVVNSHPRLSFDNTNRLFASLRPNSQDRQATSMKSAGVDINTVVFEKSYA